MIHQPLPCMESGVFPDFVSALGEVTWCYLWYSLINRKIRDRQHNRYMLPDQSCQPVRAH